MKTLTQAFEDVFISAEKRRKELKWTQQDVADRTPGVNNRQTVASALKGNATVGTIKAILYTLDKGE